MKNQELYYEAKGTHSVDVEAAYEHAKAHNIKYYRLISGSGKIFGWENGKHVAAKEGQEWFENPFYVAPALELEEKAIEQEELSLPNTEPINEVEAQADNSLNTPETKVPSIAEIELNEKLEKLSSEYEALLQEYKNLQDKYGAIQHALKAVKDLIEEI